MSNYHDRQPLLPETFRDIYDAVGTIAVQAEVFTAEEDAAWVTQAGFSPNISPATIVGRKADIRLPNYGGSAQLCLTARSYNDRINGLPNATFVSGQLHIDLAENDTDNPIAGFDYTLTQQSTMLRGNRRSFNPSTTQQPAYDTLLENLGVSKTYADVGQTETILVGQREGHNLLRLVHLVIREGLPD